VSLPVEADAGIAHGKAGIGFALLRWAEASGDERARTIGIDLLRADLDVVFQSDNGQAIVGATEDRSSWCRGAPGVALAGLRGGVALVDRDLLERCRWLADELVARKSASALCPCHGALGVLEFLEAACEHGLCGIAQVEQWRQHLLARILGGEWCADHGHVLESAGLMLGLAGTGYALLRAAAPDRIASVLTLD